MTEYVLIQSGPLLFVELAWQSGVLLGVGLAASLLMGHRPARAHFLVLLAIICALVTPLLSQFIHERGWGFWKADDVSASANGFSPNSGALAPAFPTQFSKADDRRSGTSEPPPESVHVAAVNDRAPRRDFWRLRELLLGVWCALSGVFAARLIVSWLAGRRMMVTSGPIGHESIKIAAAAASARLGLPVQADVRASPQVACPAIWCWGRRPVIVLPMDSLVRNEINWASVFCHELAHWLRRDHWWGLLAELLTCVLPWHPLAWFARQRLRRLSELACDEWVLASGFPSAEYAESLLSLVPQRRAGFALTAVSGRRGLSGRIQHILGGQHGKPVIGTRWAYASTVAMVIAATSMAFAQARPADARGPGSTRQTATREAAPKTTVAGAVLGIDGKPIAGASVVWISYLMSDLSERIVIADDPSRRLSGRAEIAAETRTGEDGKFVLTSEFDPERFHHQDGLNVTLLVKAPAMGMRATLARAGATDVTVQLAPEVAIHGRLLAPSGKPAAGVRATLHDFFNDKMTEGMEIGPTPTDDLVPPYGPKPRITDADGRFVFDGMPDNKYVRLDFWSRDFAPDAVVVDTANAREGAHLLSKVLSEFKIGPVRPTFDYTLSTPRPVTGRVTDDETRRPLPGMLVELTPTGQFRTEPLFSRTDADGRYRLAPRQSESYRMTVYPPMDSGYWGSRDTQQKWPPGNAVVETDFTLVKGRVVHGRVIDADTKQPISGAVVRYKPRNDQTRKGRETGVTTSARSDANGRFMMMVLPGPGVIAAQAPNEQYLRVSGGPLRSAQAVESIDVPKSGETEQIELTVRKGAVLKAKVAGPNGLPVPDVAASCNGISHGVMIDAWEPSGTGIFRLRGMDPTKAYRVFFLQADRQLGAVADLKTVPDSARPVDVSLRPTAIVRGKVVLEDGSPADGVQVQPMIVIGKPKNRELTRSEMIQDTTFYAELMSQRAILPYMTSVLAPRPKGEFAIDTLVAGAPLVITAALGRREAWISVSPLKPGEDRDIGTMTLKERAP